MLLGSFHSRQALLQANGGPKSLSTIFRCILVFSTGKASQQYLWFRTLGRSAWWSFAPYSFLCWVRLPLHQRWERACDIRFVPLNPGMIDIMEHLEGLFVRE